MIYDSPGVAFNTLEFLYQEFTREADQYAAKETANPHFVNNRYRQLNQMYDALKILEVMCQNDLFHIMALNLMQMRQLDPLLPGVTIRLRLQPYGDDFGLLDYDPYADSTN